MLHKRCLLIIVLFLNAAWAKNKDNIPEKSHIEFCRQITSKLVAGNYTEDDILNIAKNKFSGRSLDLTEDSVPKIMEKVKIASTGNGMSDILSKCADQFKNDFTNMAGDFIGFVVGGKDVEVAPPSTEVDDASEALMKGTSGDEILRLTKVKDPEPVVTGLCDVNEKRNDECGSIPNLLTAPWHELEKVVIFHGPKDQPFSESDCNCYLEKNKSNKANVIARATDESNKIDQAIVRASGKKFLNDFAQFYEDVRFYESTYPLVLKKDETSAINSNVLCNDSKAFKKKIDDTCAANGTVEDKENRLSEILGAYGDDFSHSKSDFASTFSGMVQDIENISIIPEGSTGADINNPVIINRHAFEGARLGFSESLGEVSAVDEMIAIIVSDKDFKSQLDVLIANNGDPITPLAAIETFLSDKTDSSTIKKILRRVDGKKNSKVVRRLNKALDSGNFNKTRSEIFKKGLTYHPGLKNLLLDPVLFKKATLSVGFKQESVLRPMQKDKGLISHFTQRCESLQNKLAEAVCTKTSDLKSKVNKQDMVKILAQNKIQTNEAVNLTLCAMTYNKTTANSAFSGLVPSGPFSVSDYRDRKENESLSKQNNLFSNYAKNKAQKTALSEQLNNVANSVSYGRVSSGQMNSSSGPALSGPQPRSSSAPVNSAEHQSMVKLPVPDSSTANSSANEVETNSQSLFENISEKMEKFNPATNVIQPSPLLPNNFTSSATKSAEVSVPVSNEEQLNPIREELRNSIQGNDQKKLDGLINNITDADAKELLKLRGESKKEREVLSDLRLEQERLKTQELKAQYEALEKKLELLTKEKNSASGNNAPGSSSSGLYQESKVGQGESFSQFTGTTNSTNFQATGGATRGSSTNGNDQVHAANFREQVGATNAGASRYSESKSSNSLVINAQSVKGTSAVQDPSGELISYLAKNETDSKTLIDLKESGIIFTFEVNENGKTVQKKKIIKYTELSAEAKAIVDKKISILAKKESANIERQITSLKRIYSIQALKLEILSSK